MKIVSLRAIRFPKTATEVVSLFQFPVAMGSLNKNVSLLFWLVFLKSKKLVVTYLTVATDGTVMVGKLLTC